MPHIVHIPHDISELVGDIDINSPSNLQLLQYNSTSGKWNNVTNLSLNGTISGTTLFCNTIDDQNGSNSIIVASALVPTGNGTWVFGTSSNRWSTINCTALDANQFKIQSSGQVIATLSSETSSSGTPIGHSYSRTYNQTSTASSTDLKIVRTETALGNGTHRLIDTYSGVSGSTNVFYVTNSGNTFISGTVGINTAPGTRALTINSAGPLKVQSGGESIEWLGRGGSNWGFLCSPGSIYALNFDVSNGSVGLNTGPAASSIAAQLHINTRTSSTISQIIQLASSQTADAFQINSNTGTGGDIVKISNVGDITAHSVRGYSTSGNALTLSGGSQNVVINSQNVTSMAVFGFAGLQLASSKSLTVLANGTGSTSIDGIVLSNTTAATSLQTQYSPRIRFIGQGWKTNVTAASQQVETYVEEQPVQSTSSPVSNLVFSEVVNGGSATTIMRLQGTQNAGNIKAWLMLSSGGTGILVDGGTQLVLTNNATSEMILNSGPMIWGDYQYKWASSSNVGGLIGSQTADIGLSRSAAGLVKVTNGSTGNGQIDACAANYTVSGLPASSSSTKGRMAFATDGRKNGEGVGVGTGVLCYDDGTAWRRVSDDTTVVA